MRRFYQSQIRAALAHAQAGGQALHTHRIIPDPRRAPRCFTEAVRRGDSIGHLFDTDADRLEATARQLGIGWAPIQRRGRRGQHIDLCGRALARAIERTKPHHQEKGR